MTELDKKKTEQLGNKPPGAKYPPGTNFGTNDKSGDDIWDGHDTQIKNLQRYLTKLGRRYKQKEGNRKPCEDPPDDPGLKNLAEYADPKYRPTPADWERKNGSIEEWLKKNPNVVAQSVAGVGVGYIAYRILRFIPSLFPPLWPTIPENVAIP